MAVIAKNGVRLDAFLTEVNFRIYENQLLFFFFFEKYFLQRPYRPQCARRKANPALAFIER